MKKYFLLILVSFNILKGQYNQLDTTFATFKGLVKSDAYFGQANQAIEVENSKLLVVGSFQHFNHRRVGNLVKLNHDGSPDFSFQSGVGTNSSIGFTLHTTDGKYLIGGKFDLYNNTLARRIVRLNPDGTIDHSFQSGTGFDDDVRCAALQSDGKIILAGSFRRYNGRLCNSIIRLNSDGTWDQTFNTGTGFDGAIHTLCISANGQVYVGGNMLRYDQIDIQKMVRLNSDGSLDSGFSIGSGLTGKYQGGSIYHIFELSSGKLLVGGDFFTFNGKNQKNLNRINSDGSNDNTFNIQQGFNEAVSHICTMPGNKILVCGSFTDFNNLPSRYLVQLSENGNIDSEFNLYGGPDGQANYATVASSKIMICGNFEEYDENINGAPVKIYNRHGIARLELNGSIDQSFSCDRGAENTVDNIRVVDNNTIFLFGQGLNSFDDHSSKLIKINTEAALDNSFQKILSDNGSIRDIEVLSNEQLVIVGNFRKLNDHTVNCVARLSATGELDPTFQSPVNGNGFSVINIVCHLDNGQLLIGGKTGTYKNLLRLNVNGSIDSSFLSPANFKNVLFAQKTSQGQFIVAVETYDFIPFKLYRLNSNGEIDPTFSASEYFYPFTSMNLLHDESVLVSNSYRLTKLLSTGITDSQFQSPLTSGTVDEILEDQYHHLIIAGSDLFCTGMTESSGLVRLSSSGEFIKTVSVLNDIYSIAFHEEGKLLLGTKDKYFNHIGRIDTSIGSLKDQFISFHPIADKEFGDASFSLNASTASGLPITITSSNPSVATVNGNQVTIHGIGICYFTASQSGNATYAMATSVTRVLVVHKSTQTIHVESIPDKYVDDNPFEINAHSSSGLPLLYSIVSGPATITGTTITLSGVPGEVIVEISQPGSEQIEEAHAEVSFTVHAITSVEKSSYDLTYTISPNPANKELLIEGKLNEIFIHTVDGKCLLHEKINSTRTIINIEDVPMGIYLLTLIGSQDQRSTQLIHILK